MTEMSPEEVKAIRWVEHIMAPLLVFAIIALSTCAVQTQDAVAQLKTEQDHDELQRQKVEVKIERLATKQEAILNSQHQTEVTIKEIETNQGHLKDDVQEILTILRGNGNGNSH